MFFLLMAHRLLVAFKYFLHSLVVIMYSLWVHYCYLVAPVFSLFAVAVVNHSIMISVWSELLLGWETEPLALFRPGPKTEICQALRFSHPIQWHQLDSSKWKLIRSWFYPGLLRSIASEIAGQRITTFCCTIRFATILVSSLFPQRLFPVQLSSGVSIFKAVFSTSHQSHCVYLLDGVSVHSSQQAEAALAVTMVHRLQ